MTLVSLAVALAQPMWSPLIERRSVLLREWLTILLWATLLISAAAAAKLGRDARGTALRVHARLGRAIGAGVLGGYLLLLAVVVLIASSLFR
jgi:hypothetical protein